MIFKVSIRVPLSRQDDFAIPCYPEDEAGGPMLAIPAAYEFCFHQLRMPDGGHPLAGRVAGDRVHSLCNLCHCTYTI